MSQENPKRKAVNLVVVPGHAVYNGTSPADAYDGSKWVGTYSGYRYNDEVMLYVRHIQRGINLVDSDPNSVLVFSGGKTRKAIQKSEAESYQSLAAHQGWFGAPSVAERTLLEEFATDSFENLLFGIQRFQMWHPDGASPRKVTMVGLRFKQERFEMHAAAIISHQVKGIPPFVFRYDAVNDIPDYVLAGGSAEGEELTRNQFRVWPMGDQGELLQKRQTRDPFGWYAQRPYA